MSQELYKDLNLIPPEEGFELYRYKNAEEMTTRGWSGLYWARQNDAGDCRSELSRSRGRGTPTLGACSPKRPSRDTTRRLISFRCNSLP